MRKWFEAEVTFRAQLSEYRLRNVWRRLTIKPYPRTPIKALILEDAEFHRLHEKMVSTVGSHDLLEHGKTISSQECGGFMSFCDGEYLIVLRPFRNGDMFERSLIHELAHIINGDIGRTNWWMRAQCG